MLLPLISRHSQLFCFAFIGIVNTLIHGGVLVLLVETLLLDVTLSHLLAFCTANLFSYLMNSWLTFKASLSFILYARFFMASMLSLGLTVLLSYVTNLYGLHYLIGFLFIAMLVPLLNFLALKFWAFSGGHSADKKC